MKSIYFLFNIFLLATSTDLVAQNAIPTSGGNVTGTTGNLSYTIGETFFSSLSGSSFTIIQGIQQTFDKSIVTSGKEEPVINIELTIYPNPATDFLILKISNYDSNSLNYNLYDFNGVLLERKKINDAATRIGIERYSKETFFLNITDSKKVIKTFKIIKN